MVRYFVRQKFFVFNNNFCFLHSCRSTRTLASTCSKFQRCPIPQNFFPKTFGASHYVYQLLKTYRLFEATPPTVVRETKNSGKTKSAATSEFNMYMLETFTKLYVMYVSSVPRYKIFKGISIAEKIICAPPRESAATNMVVATSSNAYGARQYLRFKLYTSRRK